MAIKKDHVHQELVNIAEDFEFALEEAFHHKCWNEFRTEDPLVSPPAEKQAVQEMASKFVQDVEGMLAKVKKSAGL